MVADADYGRAGEFRNALQDRKEAYMLDVQPTQTDGAVLGKNGRRADPRKLSEVAQGLPEKAWKRLTWAEGTKGKLTMEVARVRVQVCAEGKPLEEEEVWVVFERRENETKAYVIWGLDGLGLRAQVQLIRARWGTSYGSSMRRANWGWASSRGGPGRDGTATGPW